MLCGCPSLALPHGYSARRHGMADLRMPTTSLWQAEELEMAAMSLGLLPMSSINLQETGDVL